MCPSAPAPHPGSNPDTRYSSSAVSPRFFLCCGLGQLQKSLRGPSSSRKLHFVFHSCSGTTEKHPLQRCLCYFCRSSPQHLCSQVSLPGAAAGFFRCLLIINSCSSFGSLTSNPLSVISVLTVAASALYLIHQFPCWNYVLLMHRGLGWSFLPSCPQKQHKFHFCCTGAFGIPSWTSKLLFGFSQVGGFSLVRFLCPWYTQMKSRIAALGGFFFVSSAESCELFLYLFTWDKSQTPQYISCFHREGAGTPIQQNYNNLICLICWVSVCPKWKSFQQNQKRCKTERIFYKKLPYHRFLHHSL